MTKSDTGQLLADRMRTHLTRIRSDDTFQAAKKKDAKLRRKGVEMFSVRRPTRTMQALFVYCSTMAAGGMNLTDTNETFESNDYFEFYAVLMFTAILAFVLGLFIKYVSGSFSARIRPLMTKPQTTQSSTQTSPMGRLRIDNNEDTLRNELEETKRALQHYCSNEDRLLNELLEAQREIQKLKDEKEGLHYQLLEAENSMRPDVFTVPNGECYHINSSCLRGRSRNSAKMMMWRPCQACTVRAV